MSMYLHFLYLPSIFLLCYCTVWVWWRFSIHSFPTTPWDNLLGFHLFALHPVPPHSLPPPLLIILKPQDLLHTATTSFLSFWLRHLHSLSNTISLSNCLFSSRKHDIICHPGPYPTSVTETRKTALNRWPGDHTSGDHSFITRTVNAIWLSFFLLYITTIASSISFWSLFNRYHIHNG